MDPLHFQHLNNAMNNKIFIVPDYQRDYAWQKAEWTTLTEDIDVLYERDAFGNDESHFIGSIVLIPLDADISRAAKEIEENSKLNKFDKFNIIDGQQRITTLSILLISIRDYAEKNKIELDEAQDIAASLNTGKRDRDKNEIPILHFSQLNTQNCYNAILYHEDISYDGRRTGARRIKGAKDFFGKKIESLFADTENKQDALNKYVNQILYALTMVIIECAKSSDAFQIFESLNATGVPLTPADQVKNLILMKSNKVDETLKKWETIVEATNENDLVEFLAQYLFCKKNQRVPRKDIYREFREMLNQVETTSLLNELEQYASYFKSFKNPPATWKAARQLIDLNNLGQKQAYVPLMLAASRFEIDSNAFTAISDEVLIFIVRHQVCSQSSNKLDGIFAKACSFIKDESKSEKDIIAFFKNEQMPDNAFKEAFTSLSFSYSSSEQAKARVYLKRIEEKEHGSESPLELKTSELSIEHIIPKQPSIQDLQEWLGDEETDRLRKEDPNLERFSEDTIMNIGNLALLYMPENSSASNGNYESKVNRYQNPMKDKEGVNRGIPMEVFTLIKELIEEFPEKFDASSVEKRSRDLAKKAVDAWR